MKEALIEILRKHIELKELEEDSDTWRSIENNNNGYVPVDYAHDMVVYQNAYFSDVHDELTDISIVIYNGGTAAGIWPLSVAKNTQNYEIGSWGGVLLPPLLCERGNTTESKRKLLRKCIDALNEVCAKLHITKYKTADVVLGQGTSIWTQMLFENGAVCYGVDNECYVDLVLEEQEILSKMRRTNKYSIQKSEQLWRSEIITKNSGRDKIERSFEDFRRLHVEVSGRETRSQKTWDIQCKAVSDTNDFVVMLYDDRDELIGASLYSTTGSAGLYSVAAYRRDLFDKPVGHVSQWLAIKYMKELGMRWYYVGKRAYFGDWNQPSKKEVSIGHFKEGFATNIFLRLHLECSVEKIINN